MLHIRMAGPILSFLTRSFHQLGEGCRHYFSRAAQRRAKATVSGATRSEPGSSIPPLGDRPWIGVDLDGTLAVQDQIRSHIGAPVPAMLQRVQRWLAAGHRVKIVTARAANPRLQPIIRAWLIRAGLPANLEITDAKDYLMLELWDDRAVQVQLNCGRPVNGSISRIPLQPKIHAGAVSASKSLSS